MKQTIIDWIMALHTWRVLAVSFLALKQIWKSAVFPVPLSCISGRAKVLMEGL